MLRTSLQQHKPLQRLQSKRHQGLMEEQAHPLTADPFQSLLKKRMSDRERKIGFDWTSEPEQPFSRSDSAN